MTQPLKVLVCDDLVGRANHYAELIEQGGGNSVEVHVAAPGGQGTNSNRRHYDLNEATQQLNSRTRSYVGGGISPRPTVDKEARILFDEFEVIVMDNDLENLEDMRPTAEEFLGQIRAFTRCFFTVVLNKNPEVDFDLNLKGDVTSKADISMNDRHLSLEWLWRDSSLFEADEPEHFRPCYWPAIADETHRRERQVASIKSHLDETIVDFFDLDADNLWTFVDRSALTAIFAIEKEERKAYSFREFFEHSSLSLRVTDRLTLVGKNDATGLLPVPPERIDEIVAMVVASEIALWMRRELLAPLDVLVDLPHLLERMPFLLAGPPDTLESWNRAVARDGGDGTLRADIYTRFVEPARMCGQRDQLWFGRKLFRWYELEGNEGVSRMLENDNSPLPFPLCEDTCRFHKAEDTTEFVVGFHNLSDRRSVRQLPDVKYAPRSRFAQ